MLTAQHEHPSEASMRAPRVVEAGRAGLFRCVIARAPGLVPGQIGASHQNAPGSPLGPRSPGASSPRLPPGQRNADLPHGDSFY